ncbi:MAG: cupredoxin family copper-binding protein [Acetobacteraceae bacterium]
MTEIISLAEHGRRLLLRRFAEGAAFFALVPVVLAGGAEAADATVRIDNFTFAPTPLTIAAGTTVTWVNNDDIPHAIYCQALRLRSHPMDTNDSFSHRFAQAGTFDYICSLHPQMRGRIVVSA